MTFLKQSTFAIYPSSGLPASVWTQLPAVAPYKRTRPSGCREYSRNPQKGGIRRTYATIYDSSRHKEKESAASFHDWPTHPNPTPYQILDQTRRGPYSKHRFYALVKIYHPDRHHYISPASSLSPAVRLERYRLIVNANAILSDPVKRRAYDLYGAGWGSKVNQGNLYRESYRRWREQPGNASMNATWEDWERWYDERDGTSRKKQKPVYMSNELFVAVLCTFVVVGSMGQAKRATRNTKEVMEMREKKHTAIGLEMRTREAYQIGLNREERIESFLRQREGWNLGVATQGHGHMSRESDGK